MPVVVAPVSQPVSEPVFSDTFKIKVDGKEREILMSYGILNMLANMIGDVERMLLVAADMKIQESFVKILLAPRDEKGKPLVEECEYFNLNVSNDSIVDLLSWASEHVSSFLFKLADRQVKILEGQREKLKDLAARQKSLGSLLSSENG